MIGTDDRDEFVQANKDASKRFEKAGSKVKLNEFEGLGHDFPENTTKELVKALNGEVILVAALGHRSVAELDDQIEYAAKGYGGIDKIVGVIVNRCARTETVRDPAAEYQYQSRLFRRGNLHLVGAVTDNEGLTF